MKSVIVGNTDAHIVVDAQNDFVFSTGSLYCAGFPGEPSVEDTIENILKVDSHSFGYRATTEDKHVDGHIEYGIYGGKHCAEGTSGQKYVDALMPLYEKADENVIKGDNPNIIAYSVATSKTFAEHIEHLRKAGIKRIFVTAWAYTHCVGESAIAYASQGFEVYVVRDATRSVGAPFGDPIAMSKKLALYGVKEITTAELF